MSNMLKGLYRFLPVQLALLHFRKFQALLIFWAILAATITGHFAATFGAETLFLSPEYLGQINMTSMFLLGGAMATFIMAWHITTFIIHSRRVPFMGATRHAFLKYCINNSLIPLLFLIFYSIISIRFQWFNEHADITRILRIQLSFYLGFLVVILISFLYFFRADRNLLKVVLSRITNPGRIRDIIPYDSLDVDDEYEFIRADTYLSGRFKVLRCSELEPYHPRLLRTVLRRHHRNAITATIFAIVLLLLLGIFMDDPRLRIPAGAGFLILFSIIMGLVAAMKYFLRSWETLGWVIIIVVVSWMVKREWFDIRSIAYGMNYSKEVPVFDYHNLHNIFTPQRYEDDKTEEIARLQQWSKKGVVGSTKRPLVVIGVSGGGSRASYWTFRSLQYIDSLTNGALFDNTVLLTGASGGMIGASYWRELHTAHKLGKVNNPYLSQYQDNVGKDLLNAIIFSFAAVDLISPFSKISVAGFSYDKDRGYAMEQELISNTGGMMNRKISDYRNLEDSAIAPLLIVNGTIVNDGRKLMMAAQPVSYLCQPSYALKDTVHPAIDAVDFGTFFQKQNADSLHLTTALRMNATFPYVLPVVKLPSRPYMNVMDAGLRDNFGAEVITRYLYVMREWIAQNVDEVIYLEIRDTKEHEVFPSSEMNSLSSSIMGPAVVIQNKWEPFQSYTQGYIKDFIPYFLKSKLRIVTLQYIPDENAKAAALNFHLTTREKRDIYHSINNAENRRAVDTLVHLLRRQ